MKLWGPTFCTFAANTLFLSNSGDGPFGKLLQLTNVVPLVTRLMPAIRDLGNACCATLTPNDHARSWMHALLLLQRTRDFLDAVESENMVYTGQKGLEGPGGNFSNSLRLNVRSNVIALSACLSHLAALGVPLEVMESLSPTVLNTNANERFNGRQRRHSPNADAYEWVCLRALTIEDESSLMLGNGGFSDWSGERRSRQGYWEVLGALGLPATYKLKKPDQRASSQRRVRPSDGDLAILREFCREFQRVRCQRVTDHGKEKMGTKPSVYFTPAVVDPELNQDAESMLTRLLARTLSCADSVGAGSFRAGQESHTLLPERSLVYIKPAGRSSAVWVAELVDGLFVLISRTSSAEEPPTVTMSSQQLRIRYFLASMRRRRPPATACTLCLRRKNTLSRRGRPFGMWRADLSIVSFPRTGCSQPSGSRQVRCAASLTSECCDTHCVRPLWQMSMSEQLTSSAGRWAVLHQLHWSIKSS